MSAIASTEAIEAVSVYVSSFSYVIDKVGPLWEEIKDFVDVVFVPYGKSEVLIKYLTKRYFNMSQFIHRKKKNLDDCHVM